MRSLAWVSGPSNRKANPVTTTTFSNWSRLVFTLAYSDVHPGGIYPTLTGATTPNTMGYSNLAIGSTYHLEFTFDHSNSVPQSGFSAETYKLGVMRVDVLITWK